MPPIIRKRSQFPHNNIFQGTSGVGKTTLLRQLKILYGGGYTDEEREDMKTKIINATFRAFEEVMAAMQVMVSLVISF